jgi:hypothetical protein
LPYNDISVRPKSHEIGGGIRLPAAPRVNDSRSRAQAAKQIKELIIYGTMAAAAETERKFG